MKLHEHDEGKSEMDCKGIRSHRGSAALVSLTA